MNLNETEMNKLKFALPVHNSQCDRDVGKAVLVHVYAAVSSRQTKSAKYVAVVSKVKVRLVLFLGLRGKNEDVLYHRNKLYL